MPPFSRALLALNGGTTDELILRLTTAMAKGTEAELIAVHVVEVDWTLPIDADIAGNSEEAQRVLDGALPYKTRFGGDFAIGRTVPYVLKNAPCAVWVVREPIPEEPA